MSYVLFIEVGKMGHCPILWDNEAMEEVQTLL